jgi:threonine/homoserine/homoserine lactone efflux protein
MHFSTWLTFLAATVVVMIAPGPSVTLIVANSLRHGRRAGLENVAGFQLGFAIMVVLTLLGLASLIAAMGEWFVWVRLLGAAYLVWLGIKLIIEREVAPGAAPPRPPRGGFFTQAVAVEVSNPKALLFFGAFFPQFIDPASNAALQILIMGLTAMAVAAITDTVYALTAARLATGLSQSRVRLMRWASGSLLIGGGLWLALKGE